jgi:PEP-CTERM motif
MLLTFRSALVAACLTLAALPLAHADIISVSGSIIATGSLGGVGSFTNSLVTFTATFTTEQLEYCAAELFCQEGPNEYFLDSDEDGASFSVAVAGYPGTVPADYDNDIVEFTASPDLSSFSVSDIGDSTGRLVINDYTEETLGDNCVVNQLPIYCPVYATPLFLTSADDSTFGSSFSITAETPEPGTLTLLGTGILGLAGMARRKLFIR